MKLERRLTQPWWLSVAVPVGSLVVAFAIMGVVLALTGHSPWETYRKIVEAGFSGDGAFSATLISATPILFTGLAAAAAFRMQLFNIGAEGQLYLGAVGASWIALRLGDQDVTSTPLFVTAMSSPPPALPYSADMLLDSIRNSWITSIDGLMDWPPNTGALIVVPSRM